MGVHAAAAIEATTWRPGARPYSHGLWTTGGGSQVRW
jgi:hypothetical protein